MRRSNDWQERSLSVVMPALNEEENIEGAINTVRKIVPNYFGDWEILVFNDGSQDRTGEIAERIAKEDPRVKVTHHERPKNLGGVYKEGIRKASKEFLIMIPGDNENGDSTLGKVFELAGAADIVIPYVVNTEVRPLSRRIVSKSFVMLTNLLTGCHLRYYNGTVLHKTRVIRSIDIVTDSFGYQAEALAKLVRRKHSYREVGVELASRPEGGSKAFSFNNVTKVLKFLGNLPLDVRRDPTTAQSMS